MAQAPTTSVRTDYATGYRHVVTDIRLIDPGEVGPMSVAAKAEEVSPKFWTLRVVWGPYDDRGGRGSYYESQTLDPIHGTLGAIKRRVQRAARQAAEGADPRMGRVWS